MMAFWKTAAGRIDVLSLRERALLFVSVLLSVLVLAHQLLLEPVQRIQQQLAASARQQNAELAALRTQFSAMRTEPAVPNAPQTVRAEIAAVQARIDGVNREIARLSRAGGEVDPLPRVLLHILRRYEGLTLERTATLAPGALAARPGQVGAEAPPAAGLHRHGMEFTVSGPYHELMRYVETLEQELPALRWGTMTLSGGKTVPSLTLQVFWLEGPP